MNPFSQFLSQIQSIGKQKTTTPVQNPYVMAPVSPIIKTPATSSVTPSNTSATSPKTMSYSAPVQTKTPAQLAYENSLAIGNQTNAALAQGKTVNLGGVTSGSQVGTNTSSTPAYTQPTNTPSSTGAASNTTNPAIANYLKFLNDSNANIAKYSAPSDQETAIQQKIDAQNALEAQGQEDLTGQGRGIPLAILGRQGTKLARTSAIQTNALTNQLGTLQNARQGQLNAAQIASKNAAPLQIGDQTINPATGEVIYTKPGEQYNLGAGETRYDSKGNAVASGPAKAPNTSVVEVNGQKVLINSDTGQTIKNLGASTATGASAGQYVEGQNPSVDAWVKQLNNGSAKLSDVPAALKNLVAQGLSSGTGQATALKTGALTQAKDLLANLDKGLGAIGAKGPSSLFGLLGSPIAGTNAADYVQKLNSFKAKLSLDAVKYLKGQGAVSDSERKLLEDSVSELSTNQSEVEFKKTLTNIVDALDPLKVIDPDGGVHTFESQTQAEAFKKAIAQ